MLLFLLLFFRKMILFSLLVDKLDAGDAHGRIFIACQQQLSREDAAICIPLHCWQGLSSLVKLLLNIQLFYEAKWSQKSGTSKVS